MPLVRAYIRSSHRRELLVLAGADLRALRAVCDEIVPAAFNSEQGPLMPGSIEFVLQHVSLASLTIDVLLDIEAFDYPDRANIDERCAAIKSALREVFGRYTFAVWGKLVKAGWASDSSDPEFNDDMSMPAAIERARIAIAR
jgi:hypothetical protein